MRAGGKKHRGAIFAAVLVLGALLGGCGADDPSGTTTRTVPGSGGGLVSAGTSTAGLQTCLTCHASAAKQWEGSRHGNQNDNPPIAFYGPTNAGKGCPKCHDALNEWVYTVVTSTITTAELAVDHTGLSRPVIACESCHGLGNLHVQSGGSGPIGYVATPYEETTLGAVAVSGQFMTCTGCHQLLASDGTCTTSIQHYADRFGTPTPEVNIADTHCAQPNSFPGSRGLNAVSGNAVTGYAMDFNDRRVCANCHNPHTVDTTINQEWARSAHADRGGASSGYFSGAWALQNWSCNGTSTSGCGSAFADNRQCQRCHTTSGFAGYSDAIVNGDSGSADLIRTGQLSFVTYTAGWKPEMLKCAGCHSDNKGTVRNPGPVKANYDLFTSSTSTTTGAVTLTYQAYASHQYPDARESNLCLLCHTGRESGETIRNINTSAAPATLDLNDTAFVQTHYLTGGGTVFGATGYGFDGRSYDDPGTYRHKDIGTSAEPNTGTKGPCIGCHLSRPNKSGNHLFLPVSRANDGSGEITAVASEVCFRCHIVSSAMMVQLINDQKHLFEAAVEALLYQLDRAKLPFTQGFGYPYFQKHRWSQGTVQVTKGSAIVTGISTSFLSSGISTTNDRFRTFGIATSDAYKIASVDTDTQITLQSAYTGTSATIPYVVFVYGTTSGSANGLKDWDPEDGGGPNGGTLAKNNMGAALNAYAVEHDPGAYVHNRMYVKRMIYDSIDWLDDHTMNWSVGDTLLKLDAVVPFKTAAMEYLLSDPSGDLAFNPAERP